MPIIIIVAVILLLGTKGGRGLLAKGIGSLIGICLVLAAIGWGIYAIFNHTGVVMAIIGIVFGVLFIFWMIGVMVDTHKDKELYQAALSAWEAQNIGSFEITDVHNAMLPAVQQISEGDTNKVRFASDFPFGRVTYFLNFFGCELGDDEPLYYSPQRSLDSNELR